MRKKVEKILPEKEKRGGVKWGVVILVMTGLMVGLVAKEVVAMRNRREVVLRTEVHLSRFAEREVIKREKVRKRQEAERRRWEKMKTSKLVALTFDDGPNRATTTRLLDILAEKGAKATFFVVGTRVDLMPDLVKREIDEGHEVGAHTTRHLDLEEEINSAEEMQVEMAEMRRLVREACGQEPTLFRTPYGKGKNKAVVTENVGLPLIMWSVDPGDWAQMNAQSEYEDVLNAVYDGAVILMHDLYEPSVDAAAMIIDALHEQGYEFVTVSEMARLRGVELVPGQVRYSF